MVVADIINEIRQNNIGQYNDVGYLLSLTATMRALSYEYSSSVEVFTFDTDTTVYTPASMMSAQWQNVVQQLWLSFKDKLAFNRKTEYIHMRSKYPVEHHKPYSDKAIKSAGGQSTKVSRPTSSRKTVAVTPIAKRVRRTRVQLSHHRRLHRVDGKLLLDRMMWQFASVIQQNTTMSSLIWNRANPTVLTFIITNYLPT